MDAKHVIVSDAVLQQFMRDGREAYALLLHQQRVADLIARYGSVENWRDNYAPKFSDDKELKIARIIALMMEQFPSRLRGTIRFQTHREMLLADASLSAYWASVAQGGDEAWAEERKRIRDCQRQCAKSPDDWMGVLTPARAIKILLPIYRAWGRMLIEGGVAPEMAGVFIPPAM